MEIRFLNGDDAAQWSRLRLEALRNDPEAFSASEEEHYKLTQEDIKKRLGSGAADSFVIGAFDDGRLIGMAGFHRETGVKSSHKGRVWGVFVTPSARGAGIGRTLLEALLRRAQEIDGLDQILISVTATQVAASQLYRSLGFIPFGREPNALRIGEKFIDEDYMVLPINRLGRHE